MEKGMLGALDKSFIVLASQSPANDRQIATLVAAYPAVPNEYILLVKEATEIELQRDGSQYLRIWGPDGCIEMDTAYDISKRMPGAIPIGDDGGGRVLFYMDGKKGFGLYHVGYGDLDADNAVFAGPSLSALLGRGMGMDTF
jgi:hypothetical protein